MSLPEYYSDSISEYRAVRERVGICDLSDEGKYLLSGEDRVGFLQNLISNDIHLATENRGISATLLTAKGKVLSCLNIYALPAAYLLTMEATLSEKTYQHLMRFKFRSKIEMTVPLWDQFLVAGPQAKTLLERLVNRPLPEMTEQSFFTQEADPIFCVRLRETGDAEYHLYCRREKREWLDMALMTLGAELGITRVGLCALEMLRMEAGTLRYGIDLTEEILPNEAGLEASAISYTKGCFPGQEVIARIKTYGHINKHRMGLLLEGEHLPRCKDKVFSSEQEAGFILSSIHSPFLNRPIATAYLRTAFATHGQSVTITTEGEPIFAKVVRLPFYDRESV
jgi:folate-binding protein YgfZ